MSTLKMLERAALSLPQAEQRQLLIFLTKVVQNGPGGDVATPARPSESIASSLHPDLLPMVGIIAAEADAEEIHEYRRLKHS
jgi:hypothetical protein